MQERSYANKKFGNKKSMIEEDSFSNLPNKLGGFFGLVQNAFVKHYNLYAPKLLKHSPFFVAELDATTFGNIKKASKCVVDSRINLYHGDIFEGLFSSYPKLGHRPFHGKIVHRAPMFAYGHLDFCCTAKGLTDSGFEQNMRKLATWWNLTDIFRMDITVSKRADNGFSELMLIKYVPELFRISKWRVNMLTAVDYCDTSAMRRVFYEFIRAEPWYRNRHHFIDPSCRSLGLGYNGKKLC